MAGIGALYARGKRERSMALSTNTFLIVAALSLVAIGFVAWVMYKKVS
jgi:hypothetical protein